MNVIVLGGGGCFGLHLSRYLLEQPEVLRVVGIGLNPPKAPPFTLGIGDGDARYTYRQIDIVSNHDTLMDYLDEIRPDIVVNFAAEGEAAASWTSAWHYFDTNCTALSRLVEVLAHRDYLQRFVQISTIEVYGSVERAVTEREPLRPTSPYSASKAAFDHYLSSMHRVRDFPMNVIRPTNTYGPGQQLHRVIPKAVLCGLTGERLPLQGGGAAVKPYLHVRDLARAIYAVATQAPAGEIYNVGPENSISIHDLVEMIADTLDIPFEQLCQVAGARPGEDAKYAFDCRKISSAIGWQAGVALGEGIAEMVAWGRHYLDQLRVLPRIYAARGRS